MTIFTTGTLRALPLPRSQAVVLYDYPTGLAVRVFLSPDGGGHELPCLEVSSSPDCSPVQCS